jgi:hypothetical protein
LNFLPISRFSWLTVLRGLVDMLPTAHGRVAVGARQQWSATLGRLAWLGVQQQRGN